MICDGCLCMTCGVWESCASHARCEFIETAECEQVKSCYWYKAEARQPESTKGVYENEQMV